MHYFQGEYELAMVVVEHAKDRFPGSTSWQLAEQLLYFTRSLYRCQWQAAHTAVRQLASISKWEALLRSVTLLYLVSSWNCTKSFYKMCFLPNFSQYIVGADFSKLPIPNEIITLLKFIKDVC